MAEGIVSDVVVKILEFMAQSAFEEIIAPYFGGRRKLKELVQTMKFIKARIVDAERRGEGEEDDGALIREWLKSLKNVLFRLEDLFEEVDFADKENQQQLPRGGRGNSKLPKCLCVLFSRWSSPLKINKIVAEEGKAIMEELDGIKSNMDRLNFREISNSLRVRSLVNRMDNNRQTWSYVPEGTVVGRDEDKKKIIGMLLNSNVIDDHVVREKKNVLIIPIIGIGGLGKTALAQLVFNDRTVQEHFELKAWACISEISSLEEYTRKILKSIEPGEYNQLTLEQIQTRLREAVNNKKYLLVLDDVWDEDRDRWFRLEGLLSGGKRGSRIIVTSRSMVVAKNMGTFEPYLLRDLSEESSWALFKSVAFKEGQEEMMPELTSIGREIVKKCANVPLAIRAIGALLYCKDTVQEWRLFKDKDLLMVEQQGGGDRVMSTLKLSYDHLEPHLKQCFAYCSLFPKDYEFDKDDLIYHWMAQGYIVLLDGNHTSPEDVGHGYFMELLRRSFFQDVERDESNGSVSCKMHDLMNDLARKVAGEGCLFLDEHTHVHVKDTTTVWHVSFGDSVRVIPLWLFTSERIRSLLVNAGLEESINEVFSGLRYLRTLDLREVELESLPDTVGELKHLKYLGLGGTMKYLPESMTRLRNLQTLDLSACGKLKELPNNFNKLINLRHLILDRGDHLFEVHLFEMPPGFGKLTSLQRLSLFNVGEVNGLDALATMKDLSGGLTIRFLEKCRRKNAISEAKEANLKGKKLIFLKLDWRSTREAEEGSEEEEDRVLEWLQPPPTVEFLQVWFWRGRRFPSWGMEEDKQLPSHSCSQLPNLVSLQISFCKKCQHLLPFSTLPRLRVLRLEYLDALEYIESGGPEAVLPSSSSSSYYFPSLEMLVLKGLYKLKRWSKEYSPLRSFYLPNLVSLEISNCPKLMSMPPLVAPRLKSLLVWSIHGRGLKDLLPQSPSSRSRPNPLSSLETLEINNVDEGLESLSINLPSLGKFEIWHCPELIDIAVDCPTPLWQLSIKECPKLMSMPLVAPRLELLELRDIHGKLVKGLLSAPAAAVEESTSTISRPTLSSLKRLKIASVNEGLESLSINLPSLEDFEISSCKELINITVDCPSPLRRLSIGYCPKLMSMPLVAPRLESLNVEDIHGKLLKDLLSALAAAVEESTSTTSRPTLSSLKRLEIDSVDEGLESLSINLPSLEEFTIRFCRELTNITVECPTPLRQLSIRYCPKLMSLPPLVAPRLESLEVKGIHGKLLKDLLSAPAAAVEESTSRPTLSSLKRLEIGLVNEGLESLSINLPSLEEFTIRYCPELINITVEFPSPLRRLEICGCEKLRDRSGALKHLYPVMEVYNCPGLEEDLLLKLPSASLLS